MSEFNRDEYVALFRQMYQPIRNYIFYKTGNSDTSDDIAQETFVKVWEKRGSIRQKTVNTLLYTIAGNLCKNSFEHQQVVLEFANNYRWSETAQSPEFELEVKEFDERLQKAIGSLTEKQRVVFLMNRIDGYTYTQIAERLDISVKAVEKRMKTTLSDLKKTIEFKI
ncbi:MAG: RNA polymerase sigma factor [Carboxylicivirga sp.]|jgi:RNA polymerase sigma-70 factor (ECF subfamily)|nr:RNA polymerase sigma factor [Carboxylicivirga sp.]